MLLCSRSDSYRTNKKIYEKNIVLLTHDEHTLFDFGTEEQREQYARLTGADWNKLYNLREELLREYNRRL